MPSGFARFGAQEAHASQMMAHSSAAESFGGISQVWSGRYSVDEVQELHLAPHADVHAMTDTWPASNSLLL